jgi:hypothetical protein
MDAILTAKDEHLKALVERMVKKGFGPTELLKLVRDVVNILVQNQFVTCDLVNRELVHLGWSQPTLNEIDLHLIISVLERFGLFETRASVLH